MQKEAIQLGNFLIEKLGLESDNDTLSQWMVHYLAQQIIIRRNAIGKERIASQKRAFNTISLLLQRRREFRFWYSSHLSFNEFRSFLQLIALRNLS
jgi:hypothetical protein